MVSKPYEDKLFFSCTYLSISFLITLFISIFCLTSCRRDLFIGAESHPVDKEIFSEWYGKIIFPDLQLTLLIGMFIQKIMDRDLKNTDLVRLLLPIAYAHLLLSRKESITGRGGDK